MIKTNVGNPIMAKFDEFKKFFQGVHLGGVFKSFESKVLVTQLKTSLVLVEVVVHLMVLYHYLMTAKLHCKA